MEPHEDLENWMTNLPHKLKNIPIIHLAIPGSHDSITYGITRASKVSPDAEPIIETLKFLGPILRAFMRNWAKTQIAEITDQLKQGIRYLDFRISTKPKEEAFYFVHGLYSCEVSQVLQKINDFLATHPKEVVILDFQHFYAFQPTDHERLMQLITSTFGKKLVPYDRYMDKLTLHYMTTEFNYQVIAVYRSDAARFGQPLLWPSQCYPNPWADTMSITSLLNFLDNKVKNRDNAYGFVSQCILTPSSLFVFKHLFRSVKSKCFLPLKQDRDLWIKRQKPGRGGVNVIISDFVDNEEYNFTKEVIRLNERLLDPDHLSSSMTPVDYSG